MKVLTITLFSILIINSCILIWLVKETVKPSKKTKSINLIKKVIQKKVEASSEDMNEILLDDMRKIENYDR